MFLHSYFYPLHRTSGPAGRDAALLCSFSFGVVLGSVLAFPFSDPGGRRLALALLSSPRSAGVCVLWSILPLLAGSLLSLLRPQLPLLVLPLAVGCPLGYTAFFLFRFLGEDGLRGALAMLGPSLAALPGLFWFLDRRLRQKTESLLSDPILAAAMCLIPALAAGALGAAQLAELRNTISM